MMALTCDTDTFPEQICSANVCVWTRGLLLVVFSGKYSPRTAVLHVACSLRQVVYFYSVYGLWDLHTFSINKYFQHAAPCMVA